MTRPCAHCAAPVTRPPSWMRGRRVFCDRPCRDAHRRHTPVVIHHVGDSRDYGLDGQRFFDVEDARDALHALAGRVLADAPYPSTDEDVIECWPDLDGGVFVIRGVGW